MFKAKKSSHPAARNYKSREKNNADTKKSSVSLLDIVGLSADGELIAQAAKTDERREPERIIVLPAKQGLAAAIGDRVLARVHKNDGILTAQIMKILPKATTQTVLGVFTPNKYGGMVEPVDRKNHNSYSIAPEFCGGATAGELVEIDPQNASNRRLGARPARIVKCLGALDNPHAFSTIAIHKQEIPNMFPEAAIKEAENALPPVLSAGREDLRDVPFITIDGEDARDFDDAVFAQTDAQNPKNWRLLVAIADVAYYVRPNSALDREAFLRGNSVYFPDLVVPMLPEALSNGLCSLKPNEDRYCLVAEIFIDENGQMLRHKFMRAIMRSVARRTYNDLQAEFDENRSSEIVKNLYDAYSCLQRSIEIRGPLDLNLPEYKVSLNEQGQVANIQKVSGLTSHKLIEAFMIAANIAAADTLCASGSDKHGGIFRVHEAPDLTKLGTLRDILKISGYKLDMSGSAHAKNFNRILRLAEERGEEAIIHTAVLRSQMQAYYAAHNKGHFGLALGSYCHFTSPIRRYADLIVHRSLIAKHKWGSLVNDINDGITPEETSNLEQISEHISTTERRAMLAERDAMDRYKTAFLADKVGAVFDARISGIGSSGFFVTLEETGADGYVPKNSLLDDFYIFDIKTNRLKGRKHGKVFFAGMRLRVVLDMADVSTGSMRFSLAGQERNSSGSAAHKLGAPKKRRKKF